MVRPGYKMTELGEIPEEWEVTTIGEKTKFEGGSQPPRSNFIFEPKEGYIRLIQIRDYKDDKYATYIPLQLARKYCHEDDIMIGRYGPPIFQILKGLEGAYNVALIKASPKNNELLSEYLYYILKQDKLFNLIEHLSQRTSGQTGIDMDALKSFTLLLPSIQEQKEIAKIFFTSDDAIFKTEEIIKKTKQVKKGLMQHLLTKGIGHTKFKQTELGEIPEEWEVKSIGELDIHISDGNYSAKYPTSSEFLEMGVPFIRANNLKNFTIIWDDMKFISEQKHGELKKGHLKPGDILVSTRGDIGNVSYTPKEFDDANINAQLALLRVKNTNVFSDKFLMYSLQCNNSKRQFKELETGSALKQLPISNLKKILLQVPSLEEQQQIASILSSVDEKIEALEKRKAQLEQTKKGLMQDLLTGKVRVTSLPAYI